jgi:hypothetical protein
MTGAVARRVSLRVVLVVAFVLVATLGIGSVTVTRYVWLTRDFLQQQLEEDVTLARAVAGGLERYMRARIHGIETLAADLATRDLGDRAALGQELDRVNRRDLAFTGLAMVDLEGEPLALALPPEQQGRSLAGLRPRVVPPGAQDPGPAVLRHHPGSGPGAPDRDRGEPDPDAGWRGDRGPGRERGPGRPAGVAPRRRPRRLRSDCRRGLGHEGDGVVAGAAQGRTRSRRQTGTEVDVDQPVRSGVGHRDTRAQRLKRNQGSGLAGKEEQGTSFGPNSRLTSARESCVIGFLITLPVADRLTDP